MTYPRPCDRCGKVYKPNTKTNKLCMECRSEALRNRNWDNHKKEEKTPKSCEECGNPIRPPKRKFCSYECYWEYHRKKK